MSVIDTNQLKSALDRASWCRSEGPCPEELAERLEASGYDIPESEIHAGMELIFLAW